MISLSVLSGLGLLVAAGLVSRTREFIHPVHDVRLILGLLVTGVSLVLSGLALWSGPVVLDMFGFADLALVCRRMIGGFAPGGNIGGLAAGAAAVWVAIMALRGWWTIFHAQQRLRVEPLLAAGRSYRDYDLVVLPSPRRVAYTVGGRRSQVVLSQGLIDSSSNSMVEAITAHEAVHARHHHNRFLMVVAAIESAFGWLRPVSMAVARVRLSLERWADEEAAGGTALGRSRVRRALLNVSIGEATAGSVGFGEHRTVAARVNALSEPAPSRFSRWMLPGYLFLSAGGLFALVAVGRAGFHSVIAIANPGWCLV